jgi:hypothetical protein
MLKKMGQAMPLLQFLSQPRAQGICCVLAVFWLTLLAHATGANGNDPKNAMGRRRITVADCIRMTGLPDGFYEAQDPSNSEVADWSPDGTKFTVTLKRGNIERNTTDYSLVLFDVTKTFKSPKHQVLITFASSSNRPAIARVKWLDNGDILFLGERPNELQRLFEYSLATKKIRILVSWSTNVLAYAATSDLSAIIFLAEEPKTASLSDEDRRRGIVISTQPLVDLLFPDEEPSYFGPQCRLFVRSRAGSIRPIDRKKTMWGYPYPWDWWQLSLSPDGRYAIMQAKVVDVPDSWREYTNNLVSTFSRTEPKAPSSLWNYLLIDVRARSITPLLDSPNGILPSFLWAPDSKSLIARNVFLPLSGLDSEKRGSRRENPYVVEVKIPTREIVEIVARNLDIVRWDMGANELVLRSMQDDRAVSAYRNDASGWHDIGPASITEDDSHSLEIRIEEGINKPPAIISVNRKTLRNMTLLDLNPQFKELEFAHIELVSWKATDGHEVEGGLYLPTDYIAGKRYPLVIQTHGFSKNRFYIDGPFTTAFAAQPLANKGIMVLQIGRDMEPRALNGGIWRTDEGPREMASYEGAIDYLDSRGLIDRQRVGLIGFSRTCFDVEYALTHSTRHFAAATVSDGVDGGYLQYIIAANLQSANTGFMEEVNRGMPFGNGLREWMARAPGFNLDKVQTPVRLEALGVQTVLGMWEWFAGLERLGKPVDLILIPEAVHILQKPWDRLISQGGTVDWFSFWLKDEEDPDPAKAEQYSHWRELRRLLAQTNHKPKGQSLN